MGYTYNKVVYKCDCQTCAYTGGEMHNIVMQRYLRSMDTAVILHKYHSEEKDAKFEPFINFTDDGLAALSDLINGNLETATYPNKEERDIFDKDYDEYDYRPSKAVNGEDNK